MKKGKNKMMTGSTKENVERKKKRSYSFLKEGIVIQASSPEEAREEYKKRMSGEDK